MIEAVQSGYIESISPEGLWEEFLTFFSSKCGIVDFFLLR